MQLDLVTMVENYFAAVDGKDLTATLAFFAPDAVLTIATFDLENRGRDKQIREMFERLFERYDRIWHGNFEHVVEAPGRIATRFDVENRTYDGQSYRKRNANFFYLQEAHFSVVHVYMSGDNALR